MAGKEKLRRGCPSVSGHRHVRRTRPSLCRLGSRVLANRQSQAIFSHRSRVDRQGLRGLMLTPRAIAERAGGHDENGHTDEHQSAHDDATSCGGAREADSAFRTGGDAEAAGVAELGADGEGLAISVHHCLDACRERQRRSARRA